VLTTQHLYPQKLTLNLPTSGGRSAGIVRSRTKCHGVCLFVCLFSLNETTEDISSRKKQYFHYGTQLRNVTFLETVFTGETDFTVVRYSATQHYLLNTDTNLENATDSAFLRLRRLSIKTFFKIIPFKFYPHHISLLVSMGNVIIRCLVLLFAENCCASVFVVLNYENGSTAGPDVPMQDNYAGGSGCSW
jgi:hypothetical protein